MIGIVQKLINDESPMNRHQLLVVVWLLRCSLAHVSVVLAAKTMSPSEQNHEKIHLGDLLKISTWNCGGLSFTQKEICCDLNNDILALTETHDKGTLKNSRNLICSEPAPAHDSFSGVALMLSDKTAKCVTHRGSYGSRIAYARIRSSPCDLFVIAIYMPYGQHKSV